MILDLIISPLTLSRAPEVVELGTEGEGPDVNRPLSPYSIVLAWSRRLLGTSEPLSLFLVAMTFVVSWSSVSAAALA